MQDEDIHVGDVLWHTSEWMSPLSVKVTSKPIAPGPFGFDRLFITTTSGRQLCVKPSELYETKHQAWMAYVTRVEREARHVREKFDHMITEMLYKTGKDSKHEDQAMQDEDIHVGDFLLALDGSRSPIKVSESSLKRYAGMLEVELKHIRSRIEKLTGKDSENVRTNTDAKDRRVD